VDEVYRGHRITIRIIDGQHVARITSASGRVLPISPRVDDPDGATACMEDAKAALTRYLNYVRGS